MKNYQEKTDPLTSLEGLKTTFLTSFINQCKEISRDKAAAVNFCQLFVDPIKQQLLKTLPDTIKSEMKQNNLYFKFKNL